MRMDVGSSRLVPVIVSGGVEERLIILDTQEQWREFAQGKDNSISRT